MSGFVIFQISKFASWHGQVGQVTSDLGLGGDFVGYFAFLHHLKLVSHDLACVWQKK